MATVDEARAKVLAAISTVCDSDPATMKYKIGSKTVDKTAYLDMLQRTLQRLDESPPDPAVDLMAFDFDIDVFGDDLSEYVT
jgi:hypothetical protein